MPNETRIIRLFSSAKNEAAVRKIKVFALLVLLIAFASWAVYAEYRAQKMEAGSNEKDQVISSLSSELETSRERASEQEARETRQKQVSVYARNLYIKELYIKGNELKGYVKNLGNRKIGDITLQARVMLPDGSVYTKDVTVISSDGRPLKKWQRRNFNIIMDIAPAEDSEYTVVVTDLTFME